MPENLFHKLLEVDAEVLNPDYYQLLGLDPDDISEDQIEAQYKTKMSMLQNVRSTKYKDFVEFLKGQIKSARRTLSDAKGRKRYDRERNSEAIQQMRDMIQLFIQISGNLTEIEENEILHRGRQLNLPERAVRKLIEQQLGKFGYQRVQPSPEQIARAKNILMLSREESDDGGTALQDKEAMLQRMEEEASRLGLGSSSDSHTQLPLPSPGVTVPPELGGPGGPAVVPDARPAVGTPTASGRMPRAQEEIKIVRVKEGDRFVYRRLRGGRHEKLLCFLALPDSLNAQLIYGVTKVILEEHGIDFYRTGRDRWDRVLGQIKACDLMIADFSGPDSWPEVAEPLIITQATIAKYQWDKPVLALTQARPEQRLPGWTFVHYEAERLLDMSGESFPDRLKRAIRRHLR